MGVVKKEGGEAVATDSEIILGGTSGGLADEDRAVFFAFAADDELAAVEIDAVAIEIDEFGDAEAAREEKLDDSTVTKAGFGIGRDGVQKVFYFVEVEEGDLFFDGTREVDERRVEGFDVSSGEVFEKASQGDEMVGLSEGGETFVANVVRVAVEL